MSVSDLYKLADIVWVTKLSEITLDKGRVGDTDVLVAVNIGSCNIQTVRHG